MQQAWVIERQGTPRESLVLKKDWPVPSDLAVGEVLVKVHAVALSALELKLMHMLPNLIGKRPLAAGFDLAGTIEDPNDSEFVAGDEVFGFIPPLSGKGALQQYAVVSAQQLVTKPGNITSVEAAGISITAQTAWQGLFTHGEMKPGQTVFINGGSTAVGAYAIQLAKAKGAARVVASASREDAEYVRRLGADEVIDYSRQPLHEYLEDNPPATMYHIMFDTVGLTNPDLYMSSPSCLDPEGVFVTVGVTPGGFFDSVRTISALLPSILGGVPRRHKFFLLHHDLPDLKEVAKLIEDGRLMTPVDSVYEFHDALAAYDRLATSKAKGKIVIKVDMTV